MAHLIKFLIATLATFSFVTLAQAGPAADAAAAAEQQLDAGNLAEAIPEIDKATSALWDAMPLHFGKTVLVASDPQGYGIYDLRDSSVYKKSEPLVVYFEPRGYAYGRDGEMYTVSLKLDFDITSPDGASVAAQQGFATLPLRSRVQNREFMGKLTYDFAGLPAGKYVVKTIVHDENSDKVADFSLPFEMVD